MRPSLTAERLRELLRYNPETGEFSRKVHLSNRSRASQTVGNKHSQGYIIICVDGKPHRAHRLAWLYVYGEWPKEQIDHINGDRSDNRIANLRNVTALENKRHRTRPRKPGRMLGTALHKATGRWSSQMTVNYKKIHLGYFSTETEAHLAYVAAKANSV